MAAPKRPNPQGSKSDKIWSDAVRRAVKRVQAGTKTKRLEKLADKLVDEGIAGNVAALKEIGDRLDGKSVQAVVGEDGGPVRIIVSTGIPRDDG